MQAEVAEEAHVRIPSCLINTCDCAIMVMSHLHPMPRSGTLQPVYFCEVREVPHRERHKYPSIAEMDMVNPVNHCYFFNPSYHATLPSQRRRGPCRSRYESILVIRLHSYVSCA